GGVARQDGRRSPLVGFTLGRSRSGRRRTARPQSLLAIARLSTDARHHNRVDSGSAGSQRRAVLAEPAGFTLCQRCRSESAAYFSYRANVMNKYILAIVCGFSLSLLQGQNIR